MKRCSTRRNSLLQWHEFEIHGGYSDGCRKKKRLTERRPSRQFSVSTGNRRASRIRRSVLELLLSHNEARAGFAAAAETGKDRLLRGAAAPTAQRLLSHDQTRAGLTLA